MSLSLTLGALYVVISAAIALLPVKHQIRPGIALLIAAPLLLAFIGYEHGWIWCALSTAAFLSMFRNPLRYLIAKLRGTAPELPQ